MTRGLPARRLPGVLGSLFSLCGHAHATCAGLAVAAALGQEAAIDATARAALAQQTLREHLRSLWLDGPRLLGDEAGIDAAGQELSQCPLFSGRPDDLPGWLQAHLFGMLPAAWLAGWERGPASQPQPLRAWLGRCTGADTPLPALPPLPVPSDSAAWRRWAADLDEDQFAAQPRWLGACAETGVWTRHHLPAAQQPSTPALRLGARLAEVARLASPGGAAWLALGALPLAAGEALAWVEMARGLLIHHVRLDGQGDAARVAACQVVAPTAWNFHPLGAMAAALESWLGHPGLLVAAYDPCVPCTWELTMRKEVCHA
ncbi:MAG TPA: hypothetical protein VFL86_04580 [Burkholderiaceae bacterium]|nr:hypothetical protein [Burkholderiaceae bacterium]